VSRAQALLQTKQALLQTKQAALQTKKEQGASPALKIVSTLFSRKFGFDLD
jgi:hypothetical protein